MNLSDEIKRIVTFEMLLPKLGIHFNGRSEVWIQSIYISTKQRTGSLKIDMHKNTYRCYAAGRGGSIIDFYADFYNISFTEALKGLASLFHINTESDYKPKPAIITKSFDDYVDKEILNAMTEDERYCYEERLSLSGFNTSLEREFNDKTKSIYNNLFSMILEPVRKERLSLITRVLTEFKNYCIQKPNQAAIDYLNFDRGFNDKALAHFQIFTINNYNEVNNHLKKTFSMPELQKSGLYNEKGNLIFYNHRIIIPYLSNSQIVYCRARYFDFNNNHRTDECKYLGLKNDALRVNSPKRFYNLDVISKMHPIESLYFTEGELDVIAMHILNKNAVGIPGASNLPETNLEEITKFRKLIYAGESDQAGMGLYKTLKEKLRKIGKHLDRVIFPQNIKDANELLCQS